MNIVWSTESPEDVNTSLLQSAYNAYNGEVTVCSRTFHKYTYLEIVSQRKYIFVYARFMSRRNINFSRKISRYRFLCVSEIRILLFTSYKQHRFAKWRSEMFHYNLKVAISFRIRPSSRLCNWPISCCHI